MNLSKGRGPLGLFKSFVGSWEHSGDSPMGPITCSRTFSMVLGGKWLQLDVVWSYADPKRADYVERCLIGKDADNGLAFHSFVSDGSCSRGWLSKADDVDGSIVCFEADMPAGRARQIYIQADDDGYTWRVERQVKKGWSLIVEHAYRPISERD